MVLTSTLKTSLSDKVLNCFLCLDKEAAYASEGNVRSDNTYSNVPTKWLVAAFDYNRQGPQELELRNGDVIEVSFKIYNVFMKFK